jgi:hypothetical protein
MEVFHTDDFEPNYENTVLIPRRIVDDLNKQVCVCVCVWGGGGPPGGAPPPPPPTHTHAHSRSHSTWLPQVIALGNIKVDHLKSVMQLRTVVHVLEWELKRLTMECEDHTSNIRALQLMRVTKDLLHDEGIPLAEKYDYYYPFPLPFFILKTLTVVPPHGWLECTHPLSRTHVRMLLFIL